jgi:hypothetical protein
VALGGLWDAVSCVSHAHLQYGHEALAQPGLTYLQEQYSATSHVRFLQRRPSDPALYLCSGKTFGPAPQVPGGHRRRLVCKRRILRTNTCAPLPSDARWCWTRAALCD